MKELIHRLETISGLSTYGLTNWSWDEADIAALRAGLKALKRDEEAREVEPFSYNIESSLLFLRLYLADEFRLASGVNKKTVLSLGASYLRSTALKMEAEAEALE